MISMMTYMQKRILASKEVSYDLWLRMCMLHVWVSLVKGRKFITKDGELVENAAGNGALRVMIGGLIATMVSLLVTLRGVLSIVLLLTLLPLVPLVALFAHLWTRRKLAKSLRDFEAKVAAARQGVNR